MNKRFLLPLMAVAAIGAGAKVTLGPVITDNMVLAQNTDARIYGKADPGATVTVSPSWSGSPVSTTADRTGSWCVAVKTPAGGYTPYTITVSDGEPVTVSNVLVGEVWLASGQSNMEMPLKGFPGCCIDEGYEEIAKSRSAAEKVRFFTVPRVQSYEPVDTVDAQWVVPSPEVAPEFSAVGWYFANRLADGLDVPVGIVSDAYGGAMVESWSPRHLVETYPDISLDKADVESMVHYLRPVLMYNAMFYPVRNYTYDGIIWYQGCSNVRNYKYYAERLANMVKQWRYEIGLGDIPFYMVELAPFQYTDPAEIGRSAYQREQQWKALELIPNSDMICINDLVKPYERYNIHPGDKKHVGYRLGDLALNKTYGKKHFLAGSPKYKSHRVSGDEMWVSIDSPNDGICRNYDIRGFEVAGADRVFHPADTAWLHWQTNEIVVSSKKVKNPVAVRYCFRDFMSGTLHGGNYLPLIPFRSDDWDTPTD